MPIPVVNTPPNVSDTVISWAQSKAVDGFIKPNLVLRMATDQNWIFDYKMTPDGYSHPVSAKAMMNCGMPGMRLPGVLSWATTENIDSPVHSATLDVADVLPISQTTTTLQGYLPAATVFPAIIRSDVPATFHSSRALQHWVKDRDGVSVPLDGGQPLYNYSYEVLGYTYTYQEDRLLYRVFDSEGIVVGSLAKFPDPRVPDDESDDNSYWPQSSTGVGCYFILIDQEVIRVHDWDFVNNILRIPPGGRGINGIVQAHSAGATVSLLGFGPYTGKWAGIGYLSTTEAKPYKSLVRPGACFVSYEGYGDFGNSLSKMPWSPITNPGYEFTGYWFVKSQEASIQEDGVPKTSIEMASSGQILQHQKITPDVIIRMKNQLVNWADSAFDQAGIDRNIPGDWVDFHAWEADRPNSYPLAIKTEYAQHKQFFDHMQDTEYGKTCEFCQQEWLAFVTRPGYVLGHNPAGEARAVGKHIYKESIRVYNGGNGSFEAGPLRTYGMLMIRLAQAAYENPIVGNPLAQRWSKIPHRLFENMSNMQTGRVWAGQLSFQFQGETADFPYTSALQIAVDREAHYFIDSLMCPFESSYDKQDWFQPLQDLADMNRMTFQFTRAGYPVFIPRGLCLRGLSGSSAFDDTHVRADQAGRWFMGWGGSISSYSYNMDVDSVLTLVYVSGTTAFDSEFSVVAAGTTFDTANQNLIWYSSKIGNKDGLQLTGGVQQLDTLALDNLVLGLDWNTNPAGWSLRVDRTSAGDGIVEISKKPPIPNAIIGALRTNNSTDVKNFKRLFNFLISRRYIFYVAVEDGFIDGPVSVNDDFGADETAMCKRMQKFFEIDQTGVWDYTDYRYAAAWFETNEEYIKKDVWWYALSGYDWDYYVAAVTGVPIPQYKDDENTSEDPVWLVDQLALRSKIEDWQQHFFKQAINIGNKAVDDSIEKATVRTFSSNIADPRIQLGDIVYLTIPGYLDANDAYGDPGPPSSPYRNATYITQISRQMDLTSGSYSATFSGYRYRADADQVLSQTRTPYFAGQTTHTLRYYSGGTENGGPTGPIDEGGGGGDGDLFFTF